MPQATHRPVRGPLPAQLLLGLAIAWARAAAAAPVVLADAAANAGYTESHDASFRANRATSDVRGSLALEFTSRRVTTRTGYSLTASTTLRDPNGDSRAFANEVFVTSTVDLTRRSSLVLSASGSQGTTTLRLTQRAPESGQPTFSTRSNLDVVAVVASESYTFQRSPTSRMSQSLAASAMAPRDAPEASNITVVSSLVVDHTSGRNTWGSELRSSATSLHRQTATARNEQYWNARNALLLHWARDLTPNLLARVQGGVEQSATLVDSYPLAVVPKGAATLLYLGQNGGGELAGTYGVAADLATGTVALRESVSARAFVNLATRTPVQIGVSAGFVHSEPLGEVRARAAAGTGNAVQGDAGLLWSASDRFAVGARYSISYLYDQPPPVLPSRTQVLMIGATLRYASGRRVVAPAFAPDAMPRGAATVPDAAR